MLSLISSSVAVVHQQTASLPLSPSAQTSRLTFPHPINAAKSIHLGWGLGKSSIRSRRRGVKAAGGPLLFSCWRRSSRGDKRGWPNLAAGAAIQGKQRDGQCQQGSSVLVLLAWKGRTGSPCVPSRAQPRAMLRTAPGAPPGWPGSAKEPLRGSQGRLGWSLPCCSIFHS